MKMNIYLDGDGWMCEDDSPETKELFGTNTLPMSSCTCAANAKRLFLTYC